MGPGAHVASGSARVSNVILNGTPIIATGVPNRQVTSPNCRLILDEQGVDAPGTNHYGLTVNALSLVVNGVAGICHASAHADVDYPPAGTPPTCTGDDFMTGSDSVTTSSGAK